MSPQFSKIVCADAAALSRTAAESIAEYAKSCAERGRFTIALSGGSTPRGAYENLAQTPLFEAMPWQKTFVYFGDERHVRPDHPDSNYRMAFEAILKRVPIPPANVFPIPTTDPDSFKCAERYTELLRMQFRRNSDVDFPVFDLVLLGIGPDGHTASLFPGTPAAAERRRWVTACDPTITNPDINPPVERITITTPVIWNALRVFVLAAGPDKKPVLQMIFDDHEPENPPVSRLLRQCRGEVTFFIDNAADT